MNHPSSKGLRELAEFLDCCAADGVAVEPLLHVYFSQRRAGFERAQRTCTELCRRLDTTITVGPGQYDDAMIDTQFSGVPVQFAFDKTAVCEQVDEPGTVRVWRAKP